MELGREALSETPETKRQENAVVQRRRKPRTKPRDVFSKSGSPPAKAPAKEKPGPAKAPAPITPKSAPTPSKVPVPPTVKEDEVATPEAAHDDDQETAKTAIQESIIEEQLLREPRKGIGLRPSENEVEEADDEGSQTSKRAQDIIDKSKARASEKTVQKAKAPEVESTPAPVQVRKRRRVKPSFQPAERKKRLDRSRHMEYKYEVRRLLVDINVAEEHRSSILGSVWAKGERQTVADAKEFLSEKFDEGILDGEQLDAMSKIVDNYTIRR